MKPALAAIAIMAVWLYVADDLTGRKARQAAALAAHQALQAALQ